MVNGQIVEIRLSSVKGMKPLSGRSLDDFEILVRAKAEDIVTKWIDFFVRGRQITSEKITQRIT